MRPVLLGAVTVVAAALAGTNELSAHLPGVVTGGDYNDTPGDVVAEVRP